MQGSIVKEFGVIVYARTIVVLLLAVAASACSVNVTHSFCDCYLFIVLNYLPVSLGHVTDDKD